MNQFKVKKARVDFLINDSITQSNNLEETWRGCRLDRLCEKNGIATCYSLLAEAWKYLNKILIKFETFLEDSIDNNRIKNPG